MDPSFWVGLFGCIGVIVTGVLTHAKNVSQDKAAHKRDLRINTLEAEHRLCDEERKRLLEQINTFLALKVNGKKEP